MAERDARSSRMFWVTAWWVTALVAAVLVFFILSLLIPDDPAAGLVFGGVTFVLVGLLMVFFGPGPAADAPAGYAPGHAAPVAPEPKAGHEHRDAQGHLGEQGHGHAPAPVATPVPGVGISERVREAARAAGEAARAAAGPTAEPVAEPAAAAAPSRLMQTDVPPPEARRPTGLDAPREGGADDLRRIRGVGVKLSELLYSLGYYHFDQIAAWTPEEIAWVDSQLEGFNGRATRDDWIGQSKILAAGGETEHSQKVDRGESD